MHSRTISDTIWSRGDSIVPKPWLSSESWGFVVSASAADLEPINQTITPYNEALKVSV